MPRSFYGGIETDKLGELGIGYVLFYEFTGEKKYLAAGIKCADALAKHIRPGDETHTPWPFRVNAQTGEVIGGNEYGGMVVANVRLFAELARLHEGNVEDYERCRKLAWDWVLKYPMKNNRWIAYFEDVPHRAENVNQAIPTMTAYYMLTQQDPASVDPDWVGDVGHLIDWVKKRFGRGPYLGAWAIDEQGEPPDFLGCCSRAGLASDTSRWGAINAWDDGYGDYIRNFLWAMGALPELAPKGEDHLLRSSSVVRHVEYGRRSLAYTTFDSEGTEVIRLSYVPTRIQADGVSLSAGASPAGHGYTVKLLSEGGCIVRIKHLTSGDVLITG